MESIIHAFTEWGIYGLWVLGVVCATIVALAAIAAGHRRKMQRDEMDTTLKLEMVQRGMAPEDIERILNAKSGTTDAPPKSSAK